MQSIVTQLKKFSARVTTANGDPTAVPGQSVAEVLDWTRKNINVNANGNIIVSELKIPVAPGAALFSFNWGAEDDKIGTFIHAGKIDTLGLEENTAYNMTYSYRGETNSFVAYSSSKELGEDIYRGQLSFTLRTDSETTISVTLRDLTDSSTNTYLEGKCSVVLSFTGAGSTTAGEFKIISIEKA